MMRITLRRQRTLRSAIAYAVRQDPGLPPGPVYAMTRGEFEIVCPEEIPTDFALGTTFRAANGTVGTVTGIDRVRRLLRFVLP